MHPRYRKEVSGTCGDLRSKLRGRRSTFHVACLTRAISYLENNIEDQSSPGPAHLSSARFLPQIDQIVCSGITVCSTQHARPVKGKRRGHCASSVSPTIGRVLVCCQTTQSRPGLSRATVEISLWVVHSMWPRPWTVLYPDSSSRQLTSRTTIDIAEFLPSQKWAYKHFYRSSDR